MEIDIQFIPVPPNPIALSQRVVIVIDVLRATSVIVKALSEGAAEIIPVATIEEAFQKAKTFPQGTTLLGGERNSRRIEGFDLGNSPREYIPERIKGKRIILTTTNGTKAFDLVSSGKEVLAACFFNLRAIAEHCLSLEEDLLIFTSGDEGNFSLEDAVCGGMFIEKMVEEKESIRLTDAAVAARILYEKFKENLVEVFYSSHHGRDLVGKGFEEDLLYCAQTDIYEVVPIFRGGVIRIRQH